MSVYLALSIPRPPDSGALSDAPRRDVTELATAVGGEVVFQDTSGKPTNWLGKLTGPHIRVAWRVAQRMKKTDVCFADGEHIGLPLLACLAIQRKRRARVVMLGHFVTRPWKLALFSVATRIAGPGEVLVHSTEQQRAITRFLGRRWKATLVPYQVDTRFWKDQAGAPHAVAEPLIVAVGAENRDYTTLIEAARGLPCRVAIAAGSHWARQSAVPEGELPENVELITTTLGPVDLRDLYARASAVVVPLFDVTNQSGVTTVLEAMAMGKPVIVSATRGQRECVTGPLMSGDGRLDPVATRDRGPSLFGFDGPEAQTPTGLYVPPDDAPALRHGIRHVLEAMGSQCGSAEVADAFFGIDAYVTRLAAALRTDAGTQWK